MKYKTWVLHILLLFFISSTITAVLNFVVDPFQQYRISDWYKITKKKQRYVTPGLAKNFNYDAAVIGSSMVENFDLSYINKALSVKSLNLAMAGMSAHEMSYLLTTVIRENSAVSKIILSLDTYELSGKPGRFRNESLPLYLYDDVWINDIKYLLSLQTLKYSLKVLTKGRYQQIDLNTIWNWRDLRQYSRSSVVESVKSGNFNKGFKLSNYRYNVLKESFKYNILHFIKENPHITFLIYYPPYSYVAYKDMLDKGWLSDVLQLKRYIASLNIENLNVFDFQCVTSITNNLNNYTDITHFSPKINEYIISSLKIGKHMVTPDNLEECLRSFERSAEVPFELSAEEY